MNGCRTISVAIFIWGSPAIQPVFIRFYVIQVRNDSFFTVTKSIFFQI